MQLLQTVEQKQSKVETTAFDTFVTSFEPTGMKLTGVQTFCNCGGVYEVTCTKVADNVFV